MKNNAHQRAEYCPLQSLNNHEWNSLLECQTEVDIIKVKGSFILTIFHHHILKSARFSSDIFQLLNINYEFKHLVRRVTVRAWRWRWRIRTASLRCATHPFLIHTWSAARSTPQNPNECTHLLSETSRVLQPLGTYQSKELFYYDGGSQSPALFFNQEKSKTSLYYGFTSSEIIYKCWGFSWFFLLPRCIC